MVWQSLTEKTLGMISPLGNAQNFENADSAQEIFQINKLAVPLLFLLRMILKSCPVMILLESRCWLLGGKLGAISELTCGFFQSLLPLPLLLH